MNNNEVEFKKVRDFGEIFNASFDFFRENFKDLYGTILKYIGPLIAILVAVFVLIIIRFLRIGQEAVDSPIIFNNFGEFTSEMVIYLISVSIISIAVYNLFIGITYSYIDLYIKKGKGNFTSNEVFSQALSFFWRILGINLIYGIFVSIGAILCLIPGIYLAISMIFVNIIIIHENKSIGQTINRTFEVANKEWWWTFLLMFVVGIMIGIANSIIKIPFQILTGFMQYNTVDNANVMLVTTIISLTLTYFVSFITTPLNYIFISMQYFSILAKTEQPKLSDKIEELGKDI